MTCSFFAMLLLRWQLLTCDCMQSTSLLIENRRHDMTHNRPDEMTFMFTPADALIGKTFAPSLSISQRVGDESL